MDQEDDPDVLPLSKRMNNIHFDGGFQTMESLPHSSSQAHASHHHNGVPNGFTNGHLNQTFSSHQHSTNVPGVENHRSNETHNSKSYSNGIGDCQGVNGMNQNFEVIITFILFDDIIVISSLIKRIYIFLFNRIDYCLAKCHL